MIAQAHILMATVTWQPAATPLQIAGAAALLSLLAIFAYARTFRQRRVASLGLLVMRLALIAALSLVLMGPSVITSRDTDKRRPRLGILLDTSGSMQTRDCQGISRAEFGASRWLGDDVLGKLARTYEIHLAGFDAQVRPLSPTSLQLPPEQLAAGKTSNIAKCISSTLREMPAEARDAALIVLSDGRDSTHSPLEPAALLARARNVPVHTVCLGGEAVVPDVLVVATSSQQCLFAGEPGQLIIETLQVGSADAQTAVLVRCGTWQQRVPVSFDGRSRVTIKVPIRQDRPGLYEYRVSVDAVAGETEKANNAQSVFLEVTTQRIKVLLLEGEPFWETKFLVAFCKWHRPLHPKYRRPKAAVCSWRTGSSALTTRSPRA